MVVQENFSLKAFNTFGIEAKARYYASFTNLSELSVILKDEQFRSVPKLILGGGSNILFTKDFDGLVLHNHIKGLEITLQNSEEAYITAGAGVLWHDLVLFAIDNQLSGMENLSLIPGTVGASPMQNIGAYGVEVKDTFHSLQALQISTLTEHTFYHKDCEFGYRESVFKKSLKGQYIILSVIFKLSLSQKLNTSYGAIQETLREMNVTQPTIKDVSDAICSIRRSKLPNPAEIGNAGSFFKNPEITEASFTRLKESFPLLPHYPTTAGFVKVPAGWLIEHCGWKGKTFGTYGVHKNQALVLVNYGDAAGKDLQNLSEEIKKSILEKFGIALETEVNII